MDNKKLEKMEIKDESLKEVTGGGFKILGVDSSGRVQCPYCKALVAYKSVCSNCGKRLMTTVTMV